jgi:ABC-type glutathione transport system ATPase component
LGGELFSGAAPRTPVARGRMGRILQVRNLTICYKTEGLEPHRAVSEVSFDVAAGEVVGLVGESGCGKSSTALALLGLLEKRNTEISGSAMLCGEELLGKTEAQLERVRGARISLVFQEPEISLSPVMQAGSQIAEVIRAHGGRNRQQCQRRAEEMLARVGLGPAKRIYSAYPHQLSGGQRQRVVLAQALCSEPVLLVADEPVAALDARSQADFLALLRNLRHELKLSILLISHSPELQASLTDRLLVMQEGRIIEEGSFEKLYRDPKNEYTRRMLGRVGPRSGVRFEPQLQGHLA